MQGIYQTTELDHSIIKYVHIRIRSALCTTEFYLHITITTCDFVAGLCDTAVVGQQRGAGSSEARNARRGRARLHNRVFGVRFRRNLRMLGLSNFLTIISLTYKHCEDFSNYIHSH